MPGSSSWNAKSGAVASEGLIAACKHPGKKKRTSLLVYEPTAKLIGLLLKKYKSHGLSPLPVALRDADSREEWLSKHPGLYDPETKGGMVHYLVVRELQRVASSGNGTKGK
jgi:hypothetical protein